MNPRENAAGDLQGLVQGILDNSPNSNHQFSNYVTRPLDLNTLNNLTKTYFNSAQGNLNQQYNSMVGQAGRSGLSQAMGMNLSNPNTLVNRNASQVANQFSPEFGKLNTAYLGALNDNPMKAFQTQLQGNQSNMNLLLQLLGLKAGQVANRDSGAGQLIGDLVGAGGQIASASMFNPYKPNYNPSGASGGR